MASARPLVKARRGGALLSRLGEQMLSLAQVAGPSAAEKRRRARARDRVTSAVRRVYAEGEVLVFGSSATGLSTETGGRPPFANQP